MRFTKKAPASLEFSRESDYGLIFRTRSKKGAHVLSIGITGKPGGEGIVISSMSVEEVRQLHEFLGHLLPRKAAK